MINKEKSNRENYLIEDNTYYKLKQDDSCHWYMIPVELEEKFNELENIQDLESEMQFMDEFEQYRINTHISRLIIKRFEWEKYEN